MIQTKKEIMDEFQRELTGIQTLSQDQSRNLKSLLELAFNWTYSEKELM